jgi:glucose-6-phosphate dehydrogenase assembly protein OpcA
MKVAEIESQLREIWKGFSEHQPEHAIIRAQVMNLIVYSPGMETEAEVTQVLSDVANQSPGRMIVLLHHSEPTMNAWVNTLCQLSSGGRKQVCSEQIMIRGDKESALQWSTAVVPLIVPDLPVFLWWHESPRQNLELLKLLTESVDRLIIDTGRVEGDHLTVLPLMEEQGEWLAISDFNWARLTPWRIAFAGLYDHPECRPCLKTIDRIEIDCEAPSHECWQAQLLTGWLGSSMNWKWAGRPNMMNSAQSIVIVETRINKGPRDRLLKVRLLSKRSEFVVTRQDRYLRSEVVIEGNQLGSQLIQIPDESLSAFLAKELTILDHDRIYEKAIRFLG